MKITKIWRNDGWYMNMNVVLDNKYRVEVRLFNEGTSDILIETVECNDEVVIQLCDDSYIEIDSSIVGNEYNLPDNLVRLQHMFYSCEYPEYDKVERSLEEVIELVKQGKMNLFKVDEYEMKDNNTTMMFKSGKFKDIERFVNDVFLLAHEIVVEKVRDSNNTRKDKNG